MYEVGHGEEVGEQIEALPTGALDSFAQVRVLLETAPWSGDPHRGENAGGPVRSAAFGAAGFVVYLILESQRRVELLAVVWLA